MADQLNQIPTSLEPIGTFGDKDIPVRVSSVWYKFFTSVSSLFTGSSGGSSGASAILDTIGDVAGGMLGRFGTGWQEFTASAANQIPVMNPSAPLQLKTISELLDLVGAVQGDILFRGAAGWQILAPVNGRYLQSMGPGADPQYVVGTGTAAIVATGVAAAGTTQGTATVLAANWNEINAVAANSGVQIVAFGVGQSSVVFNQGVNALNVYPPAGGQIDALAANAPYPLPITKSQQFFQLTALRWRSQQLG